MTPQTKNIIIWILAGIVGIFFLASGISKLTGSTGILIMAQDFGISIPAFSALGIIEILSVGLFMYPKTGILGTLLLAAFMGGAIATHLEHGLSVVPPCIITAIVWIVAVSRFPELKQRLLNK